MAILIIITLLLGGTGFLIYQNVDSLTLLYYEILEERSNRDSTEALNIINDLRGLKEACLKLYIDRMEDFINKNITDITPNMLAEYMDSPTKFHGPATSFLSKIAADEWWIGFDLKKSGKKDGVKKALGESAESVGLLGDTSPHVEYADQDIVWILATPNL
jgi:hypothetical protein